MTTGRPGLGTGAAAPADDGARPGPSDSGSIALHLLAPVATFAVLAGIVLAVLGSSEKMETALWVVAFAVALPAGLAVAGGQARALAGAPPAAIAWSVAVGTLALAAAMLLRDAAGAGPAQHAAAALAGLIGLAVPFALARLAQRSDRLRAAPVAIATMTAVVALLALAAPFLPRSIIGPAHLVPTLALAVAMLAVVLLAKRAPSARLPRRLLDLLVAGSLALVVIATPDIAAGADNIIHHHNFFLGPTNDVLHGRAMLVDSFSQYGVGIFYALALVFEIVPIGYGGLLLVGAFAMAACYLLTYLTLRAAIDVPLLVAGAMAVAVLGNVFLQSGSYLYFPSTGPLRFGLPYVLIACVVLAARYPERRRALRGLGLLTLAVAAVWSLETFVYTAAVYAAIVLLEAWGRPDVGLRAGLPAFVRGAAIGIAVAAGAIAALSVATLVLTGSAPNWGGYLDYIAVYSTEGFGTLPVQWFSSGPIMGLAIFLSAAGVSWLARDGRTDAPLLVALAGFTAFAVASFTYYLGRSHPNNLLHLLVPVVAIGTLWAAVLLRRASQPGRASIVAVFALLAAGASIAVTAFPSAESKWPDTAMAQALSYVGGDAVGTGLRSSLTRLWNQPVIDGRSVEAGQALARVQPGHDPVAVLTEPDLTTEILLRAGRRNVLPIAHPSQDNLVPSSTERVRAAIRRLRSGTLLLTSEPQPPGAATPFGRPSAFNSLQLVARRELLRRFDWQPVAVTASGLKVVRLRARP